ncbi:MAG: SAM-dependent methyltransferase [Actinomycetia bacterium]|nr:SAM-dependent methyltransferase [Actinomycetes bacterium]
MPWVAEFNPLMREAREADQAQDRAGDRAPDGLPSARRRRREVRFPPGTPLSPPGEHTVEYSLPMTKDELFGLLGTYGGVITLEVHQRADFSRRVWDFLDRQPWDQVDLPMICRCLRSTRLPG